MERNYIVLTQWNGTEQSFFFFQNGAEWTGNGTTTAVPLHGIPMGTFYWRLLYNYYVLQYGHDHNSIHSCYTCSIHISSFIEYLLQDNPQSGDSGESARFASKLLQRLSERISNAIVSPTVLAEKLYEKQFISHSVYQAAISHAKHGNDRSQELLDDVCNSILLKFINFKDFLQALQQLPQVGALPDVITSLQAEHGKTNHNKLIKV